MKKNILKTKVPEKKVLEKNILTFLYLITPYACVLVILLSMWLFSNTFVIGKNKEKILSLMVTNISSLISTTENDLNEIENLVYSMAQNPDFRDFVSQTEPHGYLNMTNFQTRSLGTYNVGNPLIRDMYVYSRATDTLIAQTGIYRASNIYFETKCIFSNIIPEACHEALVNGTWKERYSAQQSCIHDGLSIELIPYTRTLPITGHEKKQGNITMLIDKKQLFLAYTKLLPDFCGELYIFDSDGKTIASSGSNYAAFSPPATATDGFSLEEQKLDGNNFYKFTFVGDKSKWTYIFFLRRDDVLKETYRINSVLNIINLISFFLGCALCVYFTYGRNKSYLKIMSMLGIEKAKTGSHFSMKNNEFAVWQPYISNLLSENQKIKANLNEIAYTESDKIISLLFAGNFDDESTAREWIQRGSIALDGEYYLVFTLYYGGSHLSNMGSMNLKLFFEDSIKSIIDDNVYFYHPDTKQMAVLLQFGGSAERFLRDLKNLFTKIHMETSYKYNMTLLIGAGNPTNELCRIGESFRQASQVVEYNRLMEKNEFAFYRELPKNNTPYYYPLEIENKLINYAADGNTESALKLLNSVYDENFKKRTLTKDRISELIKEIYSTFHKINKAYINEEQMIYNIETFSVEKFFEYAAAFLSTVCMNVNTTRQEEKSALVVNLLEYVKGNYMNSDLSLTTLLEQFEIDDISYVSKLFKKHIGENFSVYLEKLRIDKACELLQSKKYSVKDIAEMVGYMSDVSFRRAFKKQKGVTPTEYSKN